MKNAELMKYLSEFSPDLEVGVLILDLQTRQAYPVSGYQLMKDAGFPVLLFELGKSYPMDEMVEQAGEGGK